MSIETVLIVVLVVTVMVHGVTLIVRPKQIEAAVRAALEPMARDVDSIRERLDEHEQRMLRTEAGHKALDGEISKRLTDVLMHVTRIETGMQTRTDYERLHHRINELGKQVSGSMQAIATEISQAQTKSDQAITRVTRVEQHLMEKDR